MCSQLSVTLRGPPPICTRVRCEQQSTAGSIQWTARVCAHTNERHRVPHVSRCTGLWQGQPDQHPPATGEASAPAAHLGAALPHSHTMLRSQGCVGREQQQDGGDASVSQWRTQQRACPQRLQTARNP
jgi:hypothetical protein